MVEEQELPEKIIKKGNITAWKISLLVVLLFLLSLLVIIPSFYANRILKPIIVDRFEEYTNHQYQLHLDKISWSLLSNSINMVGLSVEPSSTDTTSHPSASFLPSFKLHQLSFLGLHYSSLLESNVHFNSLMIDSLNMGINKNTLKYILSNYSSPSGSYLSLLSRLLVDHIGINRVNALYLDGKDTIYRCAEAELTTEAFSMGLSDLTIPKFKQFSMAIKEFEWKQDGRNLKLSHIHYFIDSSQNMNKLVFGLFRFQNSKNGDITFFRGGEMNIDGDSGIFSDLSKKSSSVNKLGIHLCALENFSHPEQKQKYQESFSPQWLKEKNYLSIDSIIVNIDTIIQHQSEIKQSAYDIKFSSSNMLWDKQQFKYSNLYFQMHDYRITNILNHDFFLLNTLIYNHQHLNVFGLSYGVDSIDSTAFKIDKLSLYPFDIEQFVKDKKLQVEEAIVRDPQIQMSGNFSLFDVKGKGFLLNSIEIDRLKIFKLNLTDTHHHLDIYNADCEADSIKWLRLRKVPWYKVFGDLSFRFDSLRTQSIPQVRGAFFANSSINSREGLSSEVMKLNIVDKLKRRVEVKAQDIKLSGLNWKALFNHSHKYQFHSLYAAQMALNAHLIHHKGDTKLLDSLFVIKSKNLDLPNVSLNIYISQDGDTTTIHVDSLGVFSENLQINNPSSHIISYSKLYLQSAQSFLNIPRDSLSAELLAWHLDMASKDLYLDGLKLHFFTQDSLKRSNVVWDLFLPQAFFSGIDPFAYQLNRSIICDTVRITKPDVKLRGERNSEVQYRGESESFYQSFRSFVNRYSKISLHYISVSDLNMDVSSKYLGRNDDIKLRNMNLGIRDFYVDYTSFEQMAHFMFSKEVNLNMLSFVQNTNFGEKMIKMKGVKVSSLDKRLFINDIQYFSLGTEKDGPFIFSAQGLLLKDINIVSRPQLPELYIGNMVLKHSSIEMNGGGERATPTINMVKLNLFEPIKHELSALKIGNLELTRVDLHLNHLKYFGYQGFMLNDMQITAENMNLDSSNRAFTDHKFLYSDNLNLVLHEFTADIDPMYQARFSSLSFNSRNRNIRMDSVRISPIYNKAAFSANSEYQRDRVELLVPSVEIDKLGLRDMIFRKRFQANMIRLYSPDIRIYKDKTLPFDTSVYKPMPAQMLKDLPFYLNLDTLKIQNGRLQYEELLDIMPQAGMLYFDHLNAEITGMSNNKDFREYGGVLKLSAQARFMSASNTSLMATFPLNSPIQSFVMTASASAFPAKVLNPLTRPLTLISASSGDVLQMQMIAKGDNDVGIGSMSLRYTNLKIDVLREKNLKQSQLVSFLANALLIKKNNNNLFIPRKGAIYYQRNKHRSVFNYFSHLTIIGAKTSLGIEKRKTEKRIKAYMHKNEN